MLRAGIIGAGRIAWAYDGGRWDGIRSVSHAACIDRHPGTQLAAICDPDEGARARFQADYKGPPGVTVHTDLDRFLAESLDLVVIASPSELHEAHFEACLIHAIPRILIEKPVASSVAAFQALVARHEAVALPPDVTVNYFRRFLPQVAALKEFTKAARASGGLARIDATYSRGITVNGSHLLDLLGHLLDAREVPMLDYIQNGASENPSFGLTIDDCHIAVLGADGIEHHGLELRVITQEGHMTLVRNGLDLMLERVAPNPDYPGFFHLDEAKFALPTELTRARMQNGTYLALCDLVDGTRLSPLHQSGFAQSLLERVKLQEIMK